MNGEPVERAVGVVGASSQLGVFLLPRLQAAGFTVIALSRSAEVSEAPRSGGVRWMRAESFCEPRGESWRDHPLTHLVSCGPLGVASRIAECQRYLQRVVAFSSTSVHSKARSGDARERAAMADLSVAEGQLSTLCSRRNLPLLLLRPTLIFGCGLDRNVSRLAALARRFGVIPLAGAASGLRQPVHADDLAELVVEALQAPQPVRLSSAACGGDTITYREMASRIARAVPRHARLLTCPEPLLAGAVRALSLYPRWQGLNAEMVHRQNRDLVFDDGPLREALAWNPRPFAPTPADFEIPPHARDLQLPLPM